MPLGRPPSPARAPDGHTRQSRSVALDAHLDVLVEEHRQRYALASTSAALADLVQRGLNTLRTDLAGEERAHAYREAARQVKNEAAGVVAAALDAWAARAGAAVPRVKAKKVKK